MNRQSQQLVVASVVAFLTSGIITLAGLSAAQDMNMGGTPPPGGDMGGGGFQGGDMGGGFHGGGMPDSGGFHGGDMGGGGFQGGDGGGFQGGNGQHFGDQGGNFGGQNFQSGGDNFQKDGPRFQRDGDNFQKDGPNFHQSGAPDFGGATGAGRGFRGDFGEKTGAEHEGGRFERKPMEGDMRQFGGQKMRPGAGNEKVEGGLRTFDPDKFEKMGRPEEMMGKMQKMEGEFGSRFGDMSGKDHGAAPMPKMPKFELPSLGSLEELAAEEEEEVTLPPAVLKSLAKIEAGVTKDFNKVAKSWTKLEGKLEDGISKKEEKSLVTIGTKAEGIEAKVAHVLEQLAPYAEELDPEDNGQFFAIYEKLETLSGKIGGMLDDAASYLEE